MRNISYGKLTKDVMINIKTFPNAYVFELEKNFFHSRLMHGKFNLISWCNPNESKLKLPGLDQEKLNT